MLWFNNIPPGGAQSSSNIPVTNMRNDYMNNQNMIMNQKIINNNLNAQRKNLMKNTLMQGKPEKSSSLKLSEGSNFFPQGGETTNSGNIRINPQGNTNLNIGLYSGNLDQQYIQNRNSGNFCDNQNMQMGCAI